MFIWVAVGSGLLCYLLNIMCQYDLQNEKTGNKISYFFQVNRRRGIFFVLCMIFCAGLTWLFNRYHYGPLKVVKYLLLLAGLYAIAWEDAREKKIPNRWLLYILAGRGCLFVGEAILFPVLLIENIKFTALGGLASGAIFFIAYVLSKHAIGMGDVKLVTVIGTCLGFQTTYLVMLAGLILAAFYGGIMVLQKKKSMKDEIAFGPFIAAGTLIVMLIGA